MIPIDDIRWHHSAVTYMAHLISHRGGAIGRLLLLATFVPGIGVAAPGDLDLSFNGNGRVLTGIGDASYGGGSDVHQGVVVQPDGKIITVGSSRDYQTGDFVSMARHNEDGSLDAGFGTGGIVRWEDGYTGHGIALQPDGRIVVACSILYDYGLARFLPDGRLDSSFNGQGFIRHDDFGYRTYGMEARDVAVLPDGKIIAAGEARSSDSGFSYSLFALSRHLQDGTPDPAFGNHGLVLAGGGLQRALAVQPDGKAILVGDGRADNGYTGMTARRLTTSGELDVTFNGGHFTSSLLGSASGRAVSVLPSGKILIAGESGTNTGKDRIALVRLNANGTPDATFNGGGAVFTSIGNGHAHALDMAVQADGRIVVAGYTSVQRYDAATNIVLLRYTSAGALDESFGQGGVIVPDYGGPISPYALALQRDGRILTCGAFDKGPEYDVVLARHDADYSGVEKWRKQHFNQYSAIGDAADNADPDNDGVENLIEYAFGMEPLASGTNRIPKPSIEGGRLVMELKPPGSVSGVIYGAEWSSSLRPESWLPLASTGSPAAPTFRTPVPPDGRVFMRLRVTRR